MLRIAVVASLDLGKELQAGDQVDLVLMPHVLSEPWWCHLRCDTAERADELASAWPAETPTCYLPGSQNLLILGEEPKVLFVLRDMFGFLDVTLDPNLGWVL